MDTAMKAMIILNAHADSGEMAQQIAAQREELSAQLTTALRLDGVEWRETQHPGHGKDLAEEGARTGFRYVLAGGGDGTVNEVLNGIMGLKLDQDQRPILGVLPFGTSNDFFSALKAAEASPTGDDHDGQTLALDVGRVLFDNVERYFCLTVGMGLFSYANEQYLEASHTFGRRFAHIPAAIRTLINYRFLPNVRISRNGQQSHARRILAVLINNSPVIAGGTPLTPAARIDDGHFDVCIVKPAPLLRLLWLAVQVGTHTPLHSRAIELGRIREITVTARQPLPINVDGELVPELESKAHRMAIEIMPDALRVVIPSLCEVTPRPVETAAGSAS
jgi:diacylglycerol kinase (ATP)